MLLSKEACKTNLMHTLLSSFLSASGEDVGDGMVSMASSCNEEQPKEIGDLGLFQFEKPS